MNKTKRMLNIANAITATNLFFGAISIFLSVMGKYVPAAWIIFLAIICDIADGKLARMSNAFSQFGKEFDSLADLISFVIAPAILIFTLSQQAFFFWRLSVCILVIFAGAFRLARFNTQDQGKIALFFNGLPTPAFAAIVTSFMLLHYKGSCRITPQIILFIAGALAMLMASHIKYPTFKDILLFQSKYMLGVVIVVAMLLIMPELSVLILSLTYVLGMPIKANLKAKRDGSA